MKLTEVFTKPKGKIKWDERTSTRWVGEFAVSGRFSGRQGDTRKFMFAAFKGVDASMVYPLTDKEIDKKKTWEVGFYQTEPELSHDITGAGKPVEIFNKALVAFKEFAQGAKPEAIAFTAKEPSRIKLYDIMAKKLAKGLGFNVLSAKSGTYVLQSKKVK